MAHPIHLVVDFVAADTAVQDLEGRIADRLVVVAVADIAAVVEAFAVA